MEIGTIIGIIALIIAVVTSLPVISKFFIYYLYHPKIEIFFAGEVTEDKSDRSKIQILHTGLNIKNNELKSFYIKIEFRLDKAWKLDPRMKKDFPERGLLGGYPLKGGFWFKSRNFHLPAKSVFGLNYPLVPQNESCFLVIIIYPKIHLSSFHLPRYFGEVDLKPIKKEYRITI